MFEQRIDGGRVWARTGVASGTLSVLGLAAVLLCGAGLAPAQTCEWLPGEGMPGTDATVYATTTWDPDGAGPAPEMLVIGGWFSIVDDILVNDVAAWDGTSWQAIGSGLDGGVYAMAVYNGELIVGGMFPDIDPGCCENVARWDGSAWQPLGPGLNDTVNALAVYNGELIAGGRFTSAGGVECNAIARWDGSSWQPLGGGISGWMYVPEVDALAIYNGELIAAGCFTTAGGETCNRIARWNGSIWQPLGSGMPGGSDIKVRALAVYNGELVAGGNFSSAGGVTCNLIARWDGSTWQALSSGIGGGYTRHVDVLAVYNGELIAGGWFLEVRRRAV